MKRFLLLKQAYGVHEMGRIKKAGEKRKTIAARRQSAPRWADIRKFGLKRARTRRIRVSQRRGRLKL